MTNLTATLDAARAHAARFFEMAGARPTAGTRPPRPAARPTREETLAQAREVRAARRAKARDDAKTQEDDLYRRLYSGAATTSGAPQDAPRAPQTAEDALYRTMYPPRP